MKTKLTRLLGALALLSLLTFNLQLASPKARASPIKAG
jgi:hypothetical protein